MTDKLALVNDLLNSCPVSVLLDARQPGVDVPEAYRRVDLVLQLSRDSELSDFGFSASLTFRDSYGLSQWHQVRAPWDAVYGISAPPKEFAQLWPEPPPPVSMSKRRGGLGLVT